MTAPRIPGEGTRHERKRDLKLRAFDEVIRFLGIALEFHISGSTDISERLVPSRPDDREARPRMALKGRLEPFDRMRWRTILIERPFQTPGVFAVRAAGM